MDIKKKIALLDYLTKEMPKFHFAEYEGIRFLTHRLGDDFCGWDPEIRGFIGIRLNRSFSSWSGFSGDYSYPIDCNESFLFAGKWDLNTERGRKRHDLLDHVIDCLTQEYCDLLIEAL